MGFTEPNFPRVEPEAFLKAPFLERVKTLTLNWVENGYGVPRMVHAIYIVKLVFFYALGGIVVATLTSGLPAFWHVSEWWNQPIVYQKAILWTVLFETMADAGSWGPLAGKTKPMLGGILYWARPGTIRLRPWRRVPFTAGNRRTWFDVALYLALIVSVIVALVLPGVRRDSLSAALPENASGLVNPALLIAPMVLLVMIGLRDKTIFLAARGEQYLPALLFFTVLPFVDMIIALKLLIVVVRVAAGVSKFGLHFTNVIPPMVSNSPTLPLKWLKRAHYRNFPNDLRPSHLASFMAHGPGTVVEILAPLALLLSPWPWLTFIAVGIMLVFHLFIISRSHSRAPGVECAICLRRYLLFLGFPNWDGYGIADMSLPLLTVVILAGLLFSPRWATSVPTWCPSCPLRQYAGNWRRRYGVRPRAEEKLNNVTRSSPNQIDQLVAFGYQPQWAEIFNQQTVGWRSMHSQGRGLFSVLVKNLPDIDARTVREAELVCNSLIGFNFGDGHLHNEDMIAAVQDEAPIRRRASWWWCGSSRRPSAARSSTTRSSTRHSA